MDAFTFHTRETAADHHAETYDTPPARAVSARVVALRTVYADAWYHDDAIKAAKQDEGHPYRWTPANAVHA